LKVTETAQDQPDKVYCRVWNVFVYIVFSWLSLSSEFPTSRLEMTAVADIFDRDGDGYIDYYEFVAALHPNKDAYRPTTDADKIEDEVGGPGTAANLLIHTHTHSHSHSHTHTRTHTDRSNSVL
jgi:hypothetical protein